MTPNGEPTTEAGWRAASQRLHESGDDEPYATDIPRFALYFLFALTLVEGAVIGALLALR